ncbi:hypothetical protein Pan161_26530 [Gimesia algae]|uniref:Uncharacterized protein n=2 Tax=Gimesia algae TaxID=2527971 RepID=A0A517VDC7_9PLAN|nr:hypothetical protein Pan161_26530 [Gimesia algae]
MKLYALKQQGAQWECDAELSRLTGGLSYSDMQALAEQANFRHALWEMGEAIATLFTQVVERVPFLQEYPESSVPGWEELTLRWKAD